MYLVHNRYLAAKDAEIDRRQAATLALSGQIATYRDQVAELDRRVEEQRFELVAAAAAAARETSAKGHGSGGASRIAPADGKGRDASARARCRRVALRDRVGGAAAGGESGPGAAGRTPGRAGSVAPGVGKRRGARVAPGDRVGGAAAGGARTPGAAGRTCGAQEQLRRETQMAAGFRKDLDAAASRLEVVSAETAAGG